MAVNLGRLDGAGGFRLDGIDAWDQSGFAVSGAGDVNGDGIDDMVIGAFGADPSGSRSGEAYVVFGSRSGFPANVDLAALDGTDGFRLDGVDAGDAAGVAVDGAGDVNGDGIADFIIGADWANPDGKERAGESYIVFGTRAGFPARLELAALDGTDGFRVNGIDIKDDLGWTVAGAGDVNGDGIDDVVIGAFRPDGWTGESYVVFGSRGGFAADISPADFDGTDGFRLHGIDPGDRTGWSVDGAGDINGDGVDDLIIGASEADADGKFDAGETYVVFGRKTGFAADIELAALDGTDGFRLDGISARDQAGRSVAGIGDVNGDGIDDVLIGARGGDPAGKSAAGESYVVFGSKRGFAASMDLSTLDGSNGFRLDGGAEGDRAGFWVSAAGDFNGDGIADLVVGAPQADPGGRVDAGETYVVFGSRGGFAASIDLGTIDGAGGLRLDGVDAGERSGHAVAAAGDVNGDGFDDLIVGGYFASPNGDHYAGRTYVVFGFGADDGSERLVGTPGADVISGLEGNDTILGLGGDDRLFGGIGDDAMSGGAGNDYLFGGTGNDEMLGGIGNDEMLGWSGRDLMSGGNGADTLRGGDADDTLGGGNGDDRLFGELANDALSGGAGVDWLLGGIGRDTLEGGAGNDRLTGGGGADVFQFRQGGGTDVVVDFGIGADRLDVTAFGFDSGADALALGTQDGSDVVLALGLGMRVVLADHVLADLGAGDFLV